MKSLLVVFLSALALAPSLTGYQFNLPPGTGVVNVRDHGAKGDGIADDTEAIRKAIAFVFDNDKTYNRYHHPGIVYLPAGTYKVSGPIESKGIGIDWAGGWRAGLFLLGENRDTTIIRLADNAAGYGDKAKPRYIVGTGSESDDFNKETSGGGNRAFRHNIMNLTIDAGRGNPGAIALDYVANNRGVVSDVLLRAPEGSGWCGLGLERHWPGPALIKRVEIQGFDYGVRVEHYQYGMTFEHLTLRNPRVCGIFNSNNMLAIRGLDSLARVPVVDAQGGHSTIALLDSTLRAAPGTPRETAAIQNKGLVYLRDVKVEGYATALRDEGGNKTLPATPNALRFYAWPTHSTDGGEAAPLRLPVKETPEFHSTRIADWVNVKDFPADDPADSIQRAIDSGKPIVYLPNGKYELKKTVILRGNVRKVFGFGAWITTPAGVPAFRAENVNGPSVILEHLSIPEYGIVQAGSKALVLRHVDFGSISSAPGATGDIFLEDTMGKPITVAAGQSLWGRQVNCEFGEAPLIVNHGNLWILGYKTEGEMICLDNRRGGRAEVLGALLYPLRNPGGTPMFRNDGGVFSTCYRQNGGTQYSTHFENNGARLGWEQLRLSGQGLLNAK